ncbi:MAG TPA: type III-B CRISPR module RAMP protein Cmr1 [Stellaceae bacterium]|nr:type III-B CRISPR module RAMP protein Cmr1 [Stellaceae bacterium]
MPKLSDIPVCPDPPAARLSTGVTKEYQISLVTLLFGGGVEAGMPDESLPIRGTSIRGQLRFWWRIVIGRRFGAQMWQREEEVFGSTEFPSPLDIRILEQPNVVKVDPTYGERYGPIAYALFSAVENEQQVMKEGGAFRLQLTWPDRAELENRRKAQNARRKADSKQRLPDTVDDIELDIIAAFRAWCAFGGIGARTRRGCGAIFCRDFTSELPALDGAILVAAPRSSALEAWKKSLKAYRDFRQSPRGRLHQKTLRSGKTRRVPGRSHWPEADSVRGITGSALNPGSRASMPHVPADENPNDHSVPIVPHEILPAFPRAVLGLPINFHFADGPGKNRPGQPNSDPQDVQLIPVAADGKDGDRMSSPVITRPIWLHGKWHPGVIILHEQLPNDLLLRLTGRRARSDGTDLSFNLPFDRIVASALGKLRPMRGKASALDALHDLLKANGFHEITR